MIQSRVQDDDPYLLINYNYIINYAKNKIGSVFTSSIETCTEIGKGVKGGSIGRGFSCSVTVITGPLTI